LLHVNTTRGADEIRHVYLRDARGLRPGWALTDDEIDEALGRRALPLGADR
jgi:hypothetical protein